MDFFFIRDHRQRFRFFAQKPSPPLQSQFSKSRKIWETAKKKLTGLDPRVLIQEQAFAQAGNIREGKLRILHSGRLGEKRIRMKFVFFLHRERTKHMFVLGGEGLLVPISGLAAFLPGPNVFFYFLAILMIIQWQALQGITKILRAEYDFAVDPLFSEWETAVEADEEALYPELLEKIEKARGLERLKKILWK